MHSQMQPHQHKAPVRHGKMHPAHKRYRCHAVKERHRIAAHGHAAESSKRNAEEQQDVQDRCDSAVRIIFSFKKSSVPFPVQDLMDDDKHCHSHADPLMCHFPRDLVGHKEQKKDGHGCIHDPLYDIVCSCFGHDAVPPFIVFTSGLRSRTADPLPTHCRQSAVHPARYLCLPVLPCWGRSGRSRCRLMCRRGSL